MLTQSDYIRLSMEYNLFWARIMKEHAIFIEGALTPVLESLLLQARQFRQQYALLLAETIRLANGAVTQAAIRSGQYYTRYTETAEQAVARLTGIDTDSGLTQAEYDIQTAGAASPPTEEAVSQLNGRLLGQTKPFITYQSELLNSQTSCRIVTFLYPSDISHILREAMRYAALLQALDNRDDSVRESYREFWTVNMDQHVKSMRGLFDPSEIHYFNEANRFAQVFDGLAADPSSQRVQPETESLAVFKADTTQSLLECRVKSLMNPLLTDHMLREANHFIHQLGT